MMKTTLQKLTVDQTCWNSANISQRIAYAQKALSSDELHTIFYNDGVIGWKQLPLKIRQKIK